MTVKQSRIYVAARQQATDEEICRIFDLRPERLAKYAKVIRRARAEAEVAIRYEKKRRGGRAGQAADPFVSPNPAPAAPGGNFVN